MAWRRDGGIPGGLCGVDAGGLFSSSGPTVGEGGVKEGDGQEVKDGSAFLQHSQTCLAASPGGAAMIVTTPVPLVSLNVRPFT